MDAAQARALMEFMTKLWEGEFPATCKVLAAVPDGKRDYKPDDKWSFTAAARVQGWMYSTLDNSDYVHNVYGAFDPFFVVDLKARYQFMPHAAVELGIDNVGDYKYFLFHPFPQRTVIASLKATF